MERMRWGGWREMWTEEEREMQNKTKKRKIVNIDKLKVLFPLDRL